jgi:hypothetical protein
LSDRERSPAKPVADDSQTLGTQTYRFSVNGTRPVLQFDISSETQVKGTKEGVERLTIELHTPLSGEVFEAKTSVGRIEVDRDGKVMYFSRAADSVTFTLFLERSVVVTLRKSGEVVIQTPGKILSVDREVQGGVARSPGSVPSTESIRLRLE